VFSKGNLFAWDGDFRRFLYEATVKSMRWVRWRIKKGKNWFLFRF